jgi:drug/metabolite transporter (DMT)-like permease
MQKVGSLETYAPADLLSYFGQALVNPYVVGGTLVHLVVYLLVLVALSWADVTVAVPFTAVEYCFAALLAVLILHEAVPPLRWAGIAFVIFGVVLIGMGKPQTETEQGLANKPAPNRLLTHLE